MEASDTETDGGGLKPGSQVGLWLHLYTAALAGSCANSGGYDEDGSAMARSAANVADEALKVVSERMELLALDKKRKTGGCKRCGETLAYEGAVFCGAACSAQWEDGDRP